MVYQTSQTLKKLWHVMTHKASEKKTKKKKQSYGKDKGFGMRQTPNISVSKTTAADSSSTLRVK